MGCVISGLLAVLGGSQWRATVLLTCTTQNGGGENLGQPFPPPKKSRNRVRNPLASNPHFWILGPYKHYSVCVVLASSSAKGVARVSEL